METNINEIIIDGKNYLIRPVKLKYMKFGWYNSYLALKENGLLKLLGYKDGENSLLVFLKGIFDMSEVDAELLKGLYQELIDGKSEETIKKMIEIAERLNLIKNESEAI